MMIKSDTSHVDVMEVESYQGGRMAFALRRACRCSHTKDAHSHYRRGSDCSDCGCPAYRGGFTLTISFRTSRQHGAVVLPDEVPVPVSPYVRFTHTAGTGGVDRPAASVVIPRDGHAWLSGEPAPTQSRQQA
jgi:hypothetical protein